MISVKRRLAGNVAWLLGEYLIKLLSGLLVGALVARSLGVEGYGVFQYSLGLVLVFSSISFVCGSEVVVPRVISLPKVEKEELIKNAFILRVLFSVLAVILLLLFDSFSGERATASLIVILGLTILFNEPSAIVSAWLQGESNNRPKTVVANVASIVKVLLVYLLYEIQVRGLYAYGFAWLIESIILAVGLAYIYKRHFPTAGGRWSFSGVKELFSAGLPFFGAIVLNYLYLRLDLVLLRHLGTKTALGYYASAMQVLLATTALSGVFISAAAPLLVYRANNRIQEKKGLIILLLGALMLGASVAIVGFFLLPWLLTVLFGERFIGAIPLLRWLLFGSIFLYVDAALSVFLIKRRRGHLLAIKWLIVILVSLPVHIYFIPKYLEYGAVMGYVAGYVAACIISFLFIFHIRKETLTYGV